MFLHVLLCILSANIGRHGCCISGFIPGLTHNNSETVLLAFTWQILAISTHSNWAMLEDMSTPTHMPVLCPPPHLTPPISDLPKLTPYMECLTGGDNRIYLILALATFTHSLSLSPTPSTVLHCQQTNIIHSISPCVSTLFLAVFF